MPQRISRSVATLLQAAGIAVALIATTSAVASGGGSSQDCAICDCTATTPCANTGNPSACTGCSCKTAHGQSTCYSAAVVDPDPVEP